MFAMFEQESKVVQITLNGLPTDMVASSVSSPALAVGMSLPGNSWHWSHCDGEGSSSRSSFSDAFTTLIKVLACRK